MESQIVGGNEVSVTGNSHCMAVCYPKGKTVMLHSRPLHRASRLLGLAVFLHAFRLYDTVPVFGGLEDLSLRLRGIASGRCGHRRHRVTMVRVTTLSATRELMMTPVGWNRRPVDFMSCAKLPALDAGSMMCVFSVFSVAS